MAQLRTPDFNFDTEVFTLVSLVLKAYLGSELDPIWLNRGPPTAPATAKG